MLFPRLEGCYLTTFRPLLRVPDQPQWLAHICSLTPSSPITPFTVCIALVCIFDICIPALEHLLFPGAQMLHDLFPAHFYWLERGP